MVEYKHRMRASSLWNGRKGKKTPEIRMKLSGKLEGVLQDMSIGGGGFAQSVMDKQNDLDLLIQQRSHSTCPVSKCFLLENIFHITFSTHSSCPGSFILM